MFKRRIYHRFHSGLAFMVFALLQQCHLTNPSEACVPSASCSCSTDFNNRIKVTCQVESLTDLTLSISKPEEVHQLIITGIISPSLPENAFINFSNLAILDIGDNKLQEWKGDIIHQMPSLTTLDITGNTNWTMTENILSQISSDN